MAPPRQLKPNVWKTIRILRLTMGDSVIEGREYFAFVGEYDLWNQKQDSDYGFGIAIKTLQIAGRTDNRSAY